VGDAWNVDTTGSNISCDQYADLTTRIAVSVRLRAP
jgi:hypothetical protein